MIACGLRVGTRARRSFSKRGRTRARSSGVTSSPLAKERGEFGSNLSGGAGEQDTHSEFLSIKYFSVASAALCGILGREQGCPRRHRPGDGQFWIASSGRPLVLGRIKSRALVEEVGDVRAPKAVREAGRHPQTALHVARQLDAHPLTEGRRAGGVCRRQHRRRCRPHPHQLALRLPQLKVQPAQRRVRRAARLSCTKFRSMPAAANCAR